MCVVGGKKDCYLLKPSGGAGVDYREGATGLPVVHEDVRLPELVRGHADVLNVPVLGLVPPHVDVIPFLCDMGR